MNLHTIKQYPRTSEHTAMSTLPTTQTAAQITAAKSDCITICKDAPVPTPGKGEILVRLKLRPINPSDGLAIMGLHPAFKPDKFPATPGFEGYGVVAERGFGCCDPPINYRVSAFWLRVPSVQAGNGTFQEYVCIPKDDLILIQNDITDEQAACVSINPMAALGLFKHIAAAKVPAGRHIVLTGAGSQLGRMILALCKERKVSVIAVVRRKEACEELLAAGAAACVTTDEDVAERINAITENQGAWMALDCLGGSMVASLIKALRTGGTLVSFGMFQGADFTASMVDVLSKALTITGYNLMADLEAMTEADRRLRLEKALDFFRSGVFKVGEVTIYPLKHAQDAFKATLKEGRVGKVFLASPDKTGESDDDTDWP